MKHAEIREWLTLRLYEELEAEEERALAQHLDDCAACRQFAEELEAGLGRARTLAVPARAAELPADWDARLAGSTATLRRGRWARDAVLVAAGLAAGLLLMFAWRARAATPNDAAPSNKLAQRGDSEASAFVRYLGDTPPPLATGGGPTARFSAWQAR